MRSVESAIDAIRRGRDQIGREVEARDSVLRESGDDPLPGVALRVAATQSLEVALAREQDEEETGAALGGGVAHRLCDAAADRDGLRAWFEGLRMPACDQHAV